MRFGVTLSFPPFARKGVKRTLPQERKPVAVRYAWVNVPVGCDLFNKAGLPGAPFRTDTEDGQ